MLRITYKTYIKMSTTMEFIRRLPIELQINISEYNVEHRQKMCWIFQEICYQQFCENCSKLIIGKVYSFRNCDMICCSMNCLDNFA